jgi:cob(I)alamin adenosyltransferase
MQSISTKTGDAGESGLANGERLPKHDAVFEVVGTLDELNSCIGLVIAVLHESHPEHRAFLLEIQDTLFYVGAELARSPKAKLTAAALNKLEMIAESLQESMKDEWTTKFLMPGGTVLAAHTDIARAVCRRAERIVVEYSEHQAVSPLVLRYLNRLSDYLYLLRCFFNLSAEVAEKQFIAKK